MFCRSPPVCARPSRLTSADKRNQLGLLEVRYKGWSLRCWKLVSLVLLIATGCASHPGAPVLVDCLTLWVSNLMHAELDIEAEAAKLTNVLLAIKIPIILVSNEVGLGIVPENAMARRFRDEAGRLHQAIAGVAKSVYFVAAGLPLKMK